MKYLIVLILALFALSSANGTTPTITSSSDECDCCQFLVSYVSNYLELNSTQADIKNGITEVCALLPSSLQTTCNTLVSNYADEIINSIISKENPNICYQLHICESSSSSEQSSSEQSSSEQSSSEQSSSSEPATSSSSEPATSSSSEPATSSSSEHPATSSTSGSTGSFSGSATGASGSGSGVLYF